MSWHAVDAAGRALATGRSPRGPGWSSPTAALAAAPVVTWPTAVVDDEGRCLSVAAVLGAGGERVVALLDAMAGIDMEPPRLDVLARATPAGTVDLPLALVGLEQGVEAASAVDQAWLAEVDRRRAQARRDLVAAGREPEMEAALHVALILGTERLDPAEDSDVDAHIASGAQLWLLSGAVASALGATRHDPFEGWGRLVAAGWWPIGPSGGRLVVGARTCGAATSAPAALP